MQIQLIGRLRRYIECAQKEGSPKAAILMYHHLGEKDVDPWSLCVSPEHFAEHLQVLNEEAHLISLAQLTEAHKQGEIPDRAVAITFDDGYADNLHLAKPLLEKYDSPATVFVTSGKVNDNREFWWDELERILLQPGNLPKTLELPINGNVYRRDLREDANYGIHKYNACRGWIVYSEKDFCLRQSVYLELHQLLQPLTQVGQERTLDDLIAWSGGTALGRPSRSVLSQNELLTLSQGELIEIGSHTLTHPLLGLLPPCLQQQEICQGTAFLEETLGKPIRSFAYPYGNYGKETVALVREAGFDCACTTDVDSVWHGSDRFRLPRMAVEDWDGAQFSEWLSNTLFHDKVQASLA